MEKTIDYNNLEVKDKILHVAKDLFVKNGYNGTSIRDIASASSTNVAMVNYYYRSKYNLFEIIFEDSLEILTGQLFKVFSSDEPLFKLIEDLINTYYDTLIENPQIPIFILNEINLDPEKLTKRIVGRKPTEHVMKIYHRFEKEIEAGTIKKMPTLDILLNIISMCVFPFIFERLAVKVAEKTPEEYHMLLKEHKKHVIDFVISALSP
jgi:AcrR family transcriptional regulator